MHRYLFALAATLAAITLVCLPANAQQTRSQLQTYNNANISTNGHQAITGAIVNYFNNQLVLGFGNLSDTNFWTGQNTFLGPLVGDGSQLIVVPSNGSVLTPTALADIAAAALNQPSISGTIANNHIVVGGPGAHQIQDSGLTISGQFNKIRDPGATDDSTQGYMAGSFGFNQLTGQVFVCTSAAIGAAVWINLGFPLASPIPIGWSFGSLTGGVTAYIVPGGLGANINSQAISTVTGVFSSMRIHLPNAPAGGKSTVLTLMVGAPGGGLSDTPITCTITDTATDCSDLAHTASITAGQSYTIRAVPAAGAVTSGQGAAGLLLTAN